MLLKKHFERDKWIEEPKEGLFLILRAPIIYLGVRNDYVQRKPKIHG